MKQIIPKINTLLFIGMMMILSISLSVEASSIAINPGSLRVNNMVRGGYAERTVRVSTNEERAIVRVAFGNPNNEMNNWVTLNPGESEFEIGRDNPREIRISVEPPLDTPNGNYNTSIIFMIRGVEDFRGMTGAIIDTAVGFSIFTTIVDDEVISCSVLRESISSIESGEELISRFRIQNNGNIRLNPTINIEIWNQEKSSLERIIMSNEQSILPTTIEEVSVIEPSRGLQPGQYFADISIPECRYEQSLTFDILEIGAISSEGELIGIRVPAWNNRSDEIPINPVFQNTGERAVEAYFEGVVKLDGIIKARLSTPRLLVQPKQRFEFQTYFSSDEPGRYEVSGRVYYDNKRTFEKINRFNILDQYSEVTIRDFSNEISYVIIFLAAASLSLMIMIKKKKKRMRRRHHF